MPLLAGDPRANVRPTKRPRVGELPEGTPQDKKKAQETYETLPPEEQVGCAAHRVEVDGDAITWIGDRPGVRVTYSVSKLRAHPLVGKDACLPCFLSVSKNPKCGVWNCQDRGKPGHEFNGTAHQVPEAWRQQFNKKKAFREGFRLAASTAQGPRSPTSSLAH